MSKKNKSIFEIIYNIIGVEGLFRSTGKYVAIITGMAIIIEKLLDTYYIVPNHHYIITLGFMFAVTSVPIAVAGYFLREIFGEEDE